MSCLLPLCTEPAEGDLCRLHLMRLAWTCYGKARRHLSSAVHQARERTKRDGAEGQPNCHYACPVCSRYHVGHTRPGAPERLAEAQEIVRKLRAAGHIRLLGKIAEEWDPVQGAVRSGAWIDKVKL